MLLIYGHRTKRINNIKKVRIKRGTTINVVESAQIGKNIVGVKKTMFRILLNTVSCENDKNVGSVIDDSTFTFNEIMEQKKLLQQKVLHEKPF